MALSGVKLYLPVVILVCVIVNVLVECRGAKLRHGHHSRPDYHDLEESVPRDLSSGRPEDRDSYRRMERRVRLEALEDRFSNSEEYEGTVARTPPAHRHRHEEYDTRSRDEEDRDGRSWHNDHRGRAPAKFGARKKRHEKYGTDVFIPHNITDEVRKDIRLIQQHEIELLDAAENNLLLRFFQLEVKEAQNVSVCNYTVLPISNVLEGSKRKRPKRDLEHVMCNHAGSSCKNAGAYCCIQTYKMMEVPYDDGTTETMKIYVGCVCARHVSNNLRLMQTRLPIND